MCSILLWKASFYLTCTFLLVFAVLNSHTAFSACAWYEIFCKDQSINDSSSDTSSSVATETENPVETTISPTSSQDLSPQSGNCDPSYPDFCIPSPPPDLNCGDMSQKRFTVAGSDPHGFDGDGDGIGCE